MERARTLTDEMLLAIDMDRFSARSVLVFLRLSPLTNLDARVALFHVPARLQPTFGGTGHTGWSGALA